MPIMAMKKRENEMQTSIDQCTGLADIRMRAPLIDGAPSMVGMDLASIDQCPCVLPLARPFFQSLVPREFLLLFINAIIVCRFFVV